MKFQFNKNLNVIDGKKEMAVSLILIFFKYFLFYIYLVKSFSNIFKVYNIVIYLNRLYHVQKGASTATFKLRVGQKLKKRPTAYM